MVRASNVVSIVLALVSTEMWFGDDLPKYPKIL